jgi:hypothetical protein
LKLQAVLWICQRILVLDNSKENDRAGSGIHKPLRYLALWCSLVSEDGDSSAFEGPRWGRDCKTRKWDKSSKYPCYREQREDDGDEMKMMMAKQTELARTSLSYRVDSVAHNSRVARGDVLKWAISQLSMALHVLLDDIDDILVSEYPKYASVWADYPPGDWTVR